ncbi:MAG: flagellar hook-basal body complex protein FliE [Bradymonadales bacterium]|nr:MAG: flagellar hook-basal body complex protein FliE [Bradymonadales bacterium]
MKITGMPPLTGVRLSPDLEKAIRSPKASSSSEESFGDMLKEKISQVDEAQKAADVAAKDFATGKSRNLHEAILAMEMADTSLRMAVTVRNKVIEAYQEIMRLPV